MNDSTVPVRGLDRYREGQVPETSARSEKPVSPSKLTTARHAAALIAVWIGLVVAFVQTMNSYYRPRTDIPSGIPIPFLILLLVALGMTVVARSTKFGRYVYAIGGRPDAPANVFLGRELTAQTGLLDEEAMEHETGTVLNRLGLQIASLRETVMNLSGGQRQAIAISRAVYFNARILIMDEPTAALGPEETAKVAELVHRLKGEGLGILLISHDIHDVFDLSDRLAVLKNGRLVGVCRTSDVSKDDVLAMIILGKTPSGQRPEDTGAPGEPVP